MQLKGINQDILKKILNDIGTNYTTSISYNPGAYVIKDGQLYKAKVNTSTTWVASEWDAINIMSQFTDTGTLIAEEPWDSTKQYHAGDIVQHDNKVYKCLVQDATIGKIETGSAGTIHNYNITAWDDGGGGLMAFPTDDGGKWMDTTDDSFYIEATWTVKGGTDTLSYTGKISTASPAPITGTTTNYYLVCAHHMSIKSADDFLLYCVDTDYADALQKNIDTCTLKMYYGYKAAEWKQIYISNSPNLTCIAPEYDEETQYYLNDIIIHDGKCYYLKGKSMPGPWNPDEWTECPLSKLLIYDAIAPIWNVYTPYGEGKWTVYRGHLYICIVEQATIGQFKDDEWQKVSIDENLNTMVKSIISWIAPVFNEADHYEKHALVIHLDNNYDPTACKLYRALDNITPGPWDDSKWEQTNLAEVKYDFADANSVAEEWANDATYAIGDIVMYKGKLCKAVQTPTPGAFLNDEWDLTCVMDEVSGGGEKGIAPDYDATISYQNGVLYEKNKQVMYSAGGGVTPADDHQSTAFDYMNAFFKAIETQFGQNAIWGWDDVNNLPTCKFLIPTDRIFTGNYYVYMHQGSADSLKYFNLGKPSSISNSSLNSPDNGAMWPEVGIEFSNNTVIQIRNKNTARYKFWYCLMGSSNTINLNSTFVDEQLDKLNNKYYFKEDAPTQTGIDGYACDNNNVAYSLDAGESSEYTYIYNTHDYSRLFLNIYDTMKTYDQYTKEDVINMYNNFEISTGTDFMHYGANYTFRSGDDGLYFDYNANNFIDYRIKFLTRETYYRATLNNITLPHGSVRMVVAGYCNDVSCKSEKDNTFDRYLSSKAKNILRDTSTSHKMSDYKTLYTSDWVDVEGKTEINFDYNNTAASNDYYMFFEVQGASAITPHQYFDINVREYAPGWLIDLAYSSTNNSGDITFQKQSVQTANHTVANGEKIIKVANGKRIKITTPNDNDISSTAWLITNPTFDMTYLEQSGDDYIIKSDRVEDWNLHQIITGATKSEKSLSINATTIINTSGTDIYVIVYVNGNGIGTIYEKKSSIDNITYVVEDIPATTVCWGQVSSSKIKYRAGHQYAILFGGIKNWGDMSKKYLTGVFTRAASGWPSNYNVSIYNVGIKSDVSMSSAWEATSDGYKIIDTTTNDITFSTSSGWDTANSMGTLSSSKSSVTCTANTYHKKNYYLLQVYIDGYTNLDESIVADIEQNLITSISFNTSWLESQSVVGKIDTSNSKLNILPDPTSSWEGNVRAYWNSKLIHIPNKYKITPVDEYTSAEVFVGTPSSTYFDSDGSGNYVLKSNYKTDKSSIDFGCLWQVTATNESPYTADRDDAYAFVTENKNYDRYNYVENLTTTSLSDLITIEEACSDYITGGYLEAYPSGSGPYIIKAVPATSKASSYIYNIPFTKSYSSSDAIKFTFTGTDSGVNIQIGYTYQSATKSDYLINSSIGYQIKPSGQTQLDDGNEIQLLENQSAFGVVVRSINTTDTTFVIPDATDDYYISISMTSDTNVYTAEEMLDMYEIKLLAPTYIHQLITDDYGDLTNNSYVNEKTYISNNSPFIKYYADETTLNAYTTTSHVPTTSAEMIVYVFTAESRSFNDQYVTLWPDTGDYEFKIDFDTDWHYFCGHNGTLTDYSVDSTYTESNPLSITVPADSYVMIVYQNETGDDREYDTIKLMYHY